MSLKDDILNTIDDPKAFTNKVSSLVHMPTSVVKSLTEPLGLKDYMNLAKAIDEEDPESAKRILMSGYKNLDEESREKLNEIVPALAMAAGTAVRTAGAQVAKGVGAVARGIGAAARSLGKGAVKKTSKGSTRSMNTKSIANVVQKNTPSTANTSGNTTVKTQPSRTTTSTQSTTSTQPTTGTSTTGSTTKGNTTKGTTGTNKSSSNNNKLSNKELKNIDKETAKSIKKLQNDPQFAQIVKFADLVAKNKK